MTARAAIEASAPARRPGRPVVTTTFGRVRGRRGEHADVFLGVPYAAAPVGPLRFAAPAAHQPWHGVRDATTLGPNAPQPPRSRFGRLDLSPFFGGGWAPARTT